MADTEHKLYERVPGLEELDGTDRKAILDARAQKIRDDWVKAMEARIIREQLAKCYRTQGVNHYEKCRHLTDLYLQALKENKVEGFRKKKEEAR
ncbi:hypothetical protein BZG36_01616 [Bifiguratus adelaidae]|uniref:NADH-ubiquinone oxidoreductase 12 kDa subunit, mitochondrial n=1 Tax=Bifiguratus adelaidae TaxID=1938954 RepID=A0A261Y4B1_9FUNG|nr:hypothetical protein BZG36_01616 [Bifiguratus adelaidae]